VDRSACLGFMRRLSGSGRCGGQDRGAQKRGLSLFERWNLLRRASRVNEGKAIRLSVLAISRSLEQRRFALHLRAITYT
jgi:hypothetical protein